jgi:hypothetical protein
MLAQMFTPDPSTAPRVAPSAAALIGQADAKLAAALKRIGQAELCYSATEYLPLANRVRQARQHGLSVQAAATLVADIDAIMAADDDTRRHMCAGRCTDLSGYSAEVLALHTEAMANTHRGLQHRPRLSPAEMVAQFKARGIDIAAHDGDLHVTPPHRVTEADVRLLREHKAGIIAALEHAVVVV